MLASGCVVGVVPGVGTGVNGGGYESFSGCDSVVVGAWTVPAERASQGGPGSRTFVMKAVVELRCCWVRLVAGMWVAARWQRV